MFSLNTSSMSFRLYMQMAERFCGSSVISFDGENTATSR